MSIGLGSLSEPHRSPKKRAVEKDRKVMSRESSIYNNGSYSVEELVYGQRRVSVVEGHQLSYGVPEMQVDAADPRLISIPCVDSQPLVLTDCRMSSHLLLVGRTGSGKTDLARNILGELQRVMSPADVAFA